jgi:hypothetical protein
MIIIHNNGNLGIEFNNLFTMTEVYFSLRQRGFATKQPKKNLEKIFSREFDLFYITVSVSISPKIGGRFHREI